MKTILPQLIGGQLLWVAVFGFEYSATLPALGQFGRAEAFAPPIMPFPPVRESPRLRSVISTGTDAMMWQPPPGRLETPTTITLSWFFCRTPRDNCSHPPAISCCSEAVDGWR